MYVSRWFYKIDSNIGEARRQNVLRLRKTLIFHVFRWMFGQRCIKILPVADDIFSYTTSENYRQAVNLICSNTTFYIIPGRRYSAPGRVVFSCTTGCINRASIERFERVSPQPCAPLSKIRIQDSDVGMDVVAVFLFRDTKFSLISP